ncbi:hypothetical protein ACFY4B_36975 [Kitasatospora sp. NPDC001261]|uniref:hypothetical protein n=1 Tax=Kitasatospora sp. NPDC001261 TaxID=3364012 RepID=UPI0036BE4F9F
MCGQDVAGGGEVGKAEKRGAVGAEFGVSRSTACRLLDLAATAEAIEATVRREAGLELSHAWDTGLVLPVRAVVELKGRTAELTDLIAERLADAGASGGRPPEATVVAEIVARSVADVRSRPDVPAAELAVVPALMVLPFPPDGTPRADSSSPHAPRPPARSWPGADTTDPDDPAPGRSGRHRRTTPPAARRRHGGDRLKASSSARTSPWESR